MQSRRSYLCIVCECVNKTNTNCCTSSSRLLGNTLGVCSKPNACTSRVSCARGVISREYFLVALFLPSTAATLISCRAACVLCAKAAFCVRVFCIYSRSRAHKWIVCVSNAHPVRFDEPHRWHACVSELALISPVAKI